MLTLPRLVLCPVLLALTSGVSIAQTLTISRPSLAPDRMSVTVSVPVDKRPSPEAISVVDRWVVVLRTEKNPLGIQARIVSAGPEPVLYESAGMVRLRLAERAADDVQQVDVVLLLGRPSLTSWSPDKPPGGLGFFPVEKRDKADVYLFGSWVSGVDIKPVYNLDIAGAAPVREWLIRGQPWRLNAGGSIKSADHPKVDPDAYGVNVKLGRVFPASLGQAGRYLDFQWELVRFEFSRKDELSNVLTSPTFTFSQAVLKRVTDQGFVSAALDVDLLLGLEVGRNTQSKAVPEGYGGIARLVPGVAVYAIFPEGLGLEEVRWASTYRARVLLSEEPFTDMRDDDSPVSSIDNEVRHEWKDELNFKMNPLFSLTFTHEYGSVPPAFKILNHRYTLGATVMWAWKK